MTSLWTAHPCDRVRTQIECPAAAPALSAHCMTVHGYSSALSAQCTQTFVFHCLSAQCTLHCVWCGCTSVLACVVAPPRGGIGVHCGRVGTVAPVGDKKPFTESESVGGPISMEVDSEISVDGAISLPVKVEGPGRSLSNSGQCPLSLIVPWPTGHRRAAAGQAPCPEPSKSVEGPRAALAGSYRGLLQCSARQ